PSGIIIGNNGGPFSIKFTSSTAVMSYLPANGTPGPLKSSATNPVSTASGTLGGQVLALKLNVDFSNAGILPSGFGNLTLCNTGTSLDGKTVSQILAIANTALGGGPLPAGFTYAQLT